MMIGALLQATADTRAYIIVARIISGCGVGITISAVPVFQLEFSPKTSRGLCMYNSSRSRSKERAQFCYTVACMQLTTQNFATAMAYVRNALCLFPDLFYSAGYRTGSHVSSTYLITWMPSGEEH